MLGLSEVAMSAIRAHGAREYTNGKREACGLIVAGRYIECENIGEGVDHFKIAPEQWARAEDAGEIMAVVHTHPDQPALPSQMDIERCAASGIPWLIVSMPSGQMGLCHPNNEATNV